MTTKTKIILMSRLIVKLILQRYAFFFMREKMIVLFLQGHCWVHGKIVFQLSVLYSNNDGHWNF